VPVSIKPNERYVLLAKTNDHWWQVRRDSSSKPFYIPAKYVKELPADFPSPLDFDHPPILDPVLVPVAATKPGDEVTIRLRPDSSTGYRKTENRMSTFGVPLDFHDLPHLVQSSNPPAGPAEITTTSSSLSKNHLPDGPDEHRDSGKPRVPNFSPADPLSPPRPQTQAIPVETPVVPVVPSNNDLHSTSSLPESSVTNPDVLFILLLFVLLFILLHPSRPLHPPLPSHPPPPPPPLHPLHPPHPPPLHPPHPPLPLHPPPLRPLNPPHPCHSPRPPRHLRPLHPPLPSHPPPPPPPLHPLHPPPLHPPHPPLPLHPPPSSFYYFNLTTRVTSWTPPEPSSPLSPSSPLWSPTNRKHDDVPVRSVIVFIYSQLSSLYTVTGRLDMQNNLNENEPNFTLGSKDVTSENKVTRVLSPPVVCLQCHLLEKAGIINKTKVVDHSKKIRKNWSQSWTVLHGGILTFHRDPKSAQTGNTSKASQIVPEFTVELRGASVNWASRDKSSKKNVLELKTRHGCEFLMQYDTESIISDWLKVMQDTIRQLDHEHLTEDEDEAASDREDKDRRNSSGGVDSEQRRVRTKLRRFLQRRPTLQSVKEKGYIRDNVFGCHLDTLCHRENTTCPMFLHKCIRAVERRGLDVDGIYRVSGNLAVIQRLRYKADHEEQLDLDDGQWQEIHVITGALKLFLRELPEPLFPFSCFDKFIAAIRQFPDYSLRVSYMRDLVRSLPLPNHDTMELLFKHLLRVIEHKDSNRMSVQSVAIVFGPTLLRPQTESHNMTIHMVFQSQIVELMLNEFQSVFSQS
uniref:Rho GTPase activating protein 27, like n=1 Tax=Scophthalmus maximus TaxID=52904 RepID=A0A8D3AIP1_SCOMX